MSVILAAFMPYRTSFMDGKKGIHNNFTYVVLYGFATALSVIR